MQDIGVSIDFARSAMEQEMADVRQRCRAYLNWYSPLWNSSIQRHDAWEETIDIGTDLGTTRDNFPIARACVDIWAALEASNPPTVRADPERIPAPPPQGDQQRDLALREVYAVAREMESQKADIRSARLRQFLRRDDFTLKHWTAAKRKNLYGFTWQKVIPNLDQQRPMSAISRNPTNHFPIWSDEDPGDLEAILQVRQMSAHKANAMWSLGLTFNERGAVNFAKGEDSGKYQKLNDLWFDSSRTMLWVEEFWWADRRFNARFEPIPAKVHKVVRVLKEVRETADFGWRHLPFTYWENTDERDSYGWSDIAGVMDINDEINRRISQQGDIIGMYAAPRFQLLGSLPGQDTVEMPAPFEMIPLQDTQRIEQILARIDAYPGQVHFNFLMQELLPRVTGLPPIVWGLIANAQTSGRALTASWKATETRLSGKLMRNEQSLSRYLDICLDYARVYDWQGSRTVFKNLSGKDFDDFRWNFPAMEPRDYQEVTQDAIFRRDAGLTTTIRAMRDTGVEDPEDLIAEVKVEFQDVDLHPDKKQASLLAERAQLDNDAMRQQIGAQSQQAQLPAGGQPIQTSTMVQNGAVSNRFIQQGTIGGPPQGAPPEQQPVQQGAPQ